LAENRPERTRLVRPGAALEAGTAHPAVTGEKCVHFDAQIAGGTAEGLPFVPMLGGRRAFIFPVLHADKGDS